MRIFKHRIFAKWAENDGLLDSALKIAVSEIAGGLFEANLGGDEELWRYVCRSLVLNH